MALYIPANLSRQELTDMLRSVPVDNGGTRTNLLNVAEDVRTGRLVLSASPRRQPQPPQMAQPPQVTAQDITALFPHKTPEQLFNGDIPSMLHASDVLAALRTVPVVVGSEPGNLLGVAGQLKSGNYHLILQPNFIEESAVRPAGSTDVDVTDDSVTVQRHGGRVSVTIDL